MKTKKLLVSMVVTIGLLFSLVSGTAFARDMTAKDFVAKVKKSIAQISPEKAKSMLGKSGVVILDVRTKKEFKSGHIPGAIHIPRGLLEFKISKKIPNKKSIILIYCKKGGRAMLSAFNIKKMGYKNVKNITGGWKQWSKKGYPVD